MFLVMLRAAVRRAAAPANDGAGDGAHDDGARRQQTDIKAMLADLKVAFP